MGKLIKYCLIGLGTLLVLLVAAVFIVPKLVDIQKYKPLFEEKVAAATGREVRLDGDLHLTLFPWVGVSFSDFKMGNPPGFSDRDFVKIKSFEAHVKVMPLLSRQVEVDEIVLDSPEISLEKLEDGRANWEGFSGDGAQTKTQPQAQSQTKAKEPAAVSEEKGFALKSIEVGEFAVRNGTVRIVDGGQKLDKVVSDIALSLQDVSFERPILLNFEAVADGKPLGLTGQLGPVGKNPGQGSVPVDLTLSAIDQLQIGIKGQVSEILSALSYDLALDVTQFSPRQLLEGLGIELPIQTTDPGVLERLGLGVKVQGDLKSAAISDGILQLDDSKVDFKGQMKSFSPVNLEFTGNLDTIALDRYLPATSAGEETAGSAATQKTQTTATQKTQTTQTTQSTQTTPSSKVAPRATATTKTDYEPLRKLTLDTSFRAGEVKLQGGKVEDIQLKLTAKKGVFTLKPLSMLLYSGKFIANGTLDVRGAAPITSLTATTSGVQVGPLLKDFAQKDFLEGQLKADVAIDMRGDAADAVKRSLNGKGQLVFEDGAIVGIDLAGMVRNVQASFGLTDRPTEKPRTDFAELSAPFTIRNGLINTPGTALKSPLVRVEADGSANLVSEEIDMRVRPKFVATLKGQGDTDQRSGLMVPVLVTGTFGSPVFSPDLAAIVKGQLEGQIPDAEELKNKLLKEVVPENIDPDKILEESGVSKEAVESLGKGLKGLIPKF